MVQRILNPNYQNFIAKVSATLFYIVVEIGCIWVKLSESGVQFHYTGSLNTINFEIIASTSKTKVNALLKAKILTLFSRKNGF